MTDRFIVPGISCQHCVNAVTREVSALEGVQKVNVSLADKTVTVEHGEQVTADALVAAINEAGYDEVQRLS